MAELLHATETFWAATKDGRGQAVNAGEIRRDDDPVVKHNRDKFKTVEELAVGNAPVTFGPVETATRAPGEKRAEVKTPAEKPSKPAKPAKPVKKTAAAKPPAPVEQPVEPPPADAPAVADDADAGDATPEA